MLTISFPAPGSAAASPAVKITGQEGEYPLGMSMDILEDPEGSLTMSGIGIPGAQAGFRPLNAPVPNLGFSRSVFWLRATVANASGRPQEMILQEFAAWIDELDVYIVRPGGAMESFISGERFPFRHRPVKSPHFLFPFKIAPDETVQIYLRFRSVDPLQLPITLWKRADYEEHNLGLTYYFGLIFGCLLTIFLYNFFIFFSLWDRNYLYYVAYIGAIIFMIFTYIGNSYQYIWPDSPGFQQWSVFSSGLISMLMGLFFTKGFLQTRILLPRVHAFLTLFQVLCAAALIMAAVWGGSVPGMACVSMAMVFPFIQAAVGVMAYMKDVRAARFFILAWSFSMVGIFYTMVMVMGLAQSNTLSQRSMELGLAIDAILLSFALADRIRILQRDKEMAEAQATAALTASKEELEAKVAERTAELKAAKDRAEEATALKDKFVNLVSHDLRAPIGAIIGLLRSPLENPAMAPDKREDFIQRAGKAAERLMSFIDHMLNIARLRSGGMVLSKGAFRAREAIAEAGADLESLAQRKGIVVENRVDEGMALLADRSLAAAVFSNLISNAIKFLHRGGRLSIRHDPETPGALLFEDDGPGVPEAFLPNLFRTEIRTTATGTSGERGTGLGLPYCAEIMAAHGGSISARRGAAGGSVFTVSFPIPAILALVADDQQASRAMIKDAVLKWGKADFIEAEEGREAMEMMRIVMPDVVITDLNMPGMGGLELLAEMKSSQDLRHIPVLAVTSLNGSPDGDARVREQTLAAGAADFAFKPVDDEFGAQVWRRITGGRAQGPPA